MQLEQRQAITLQAWEALGTERDLQGVLEGISDVLRPLVPFESIAIIHWESPEKHDLYALHVPGYPLAPEETIEEFLARTKKAPVLVKPRPLRPYDPELARRAQSDIAYHVPDLLELPAWYEHEVEMAEGGVRAYCSLPLLVRGKLIGAAAFARSQPIAFDEQQLTVLCDIGRALAVAVANALDYDVIRKLRRQLEAENIALHAALSNAPWFEEIVGESRALRAVLAKVEHVAATDATVLITGETGTGKELIARAVHRGSPRASGPLIKANCAAMPASLIASELFGHEKGAFTGAVERRKGRFEQAQGGTLFLDEIGELPLETQALLLRVLQEREFERVGGATTLRADVRIVAATNRNLADEVAAGRFRADLYYRLNVFPAAMPPLRERVEDIPALLTHFANKYGERFKRKIVRIEDGSVRRLQSYSWPGNVRELENAVERAVILSRDGVLRFHDDVLMERSSSHALPIDGQLEQQERKTIETALQRAHGKVAGENGAAKRLGMPASTLEFRIKKLAIDKFAFRCS